MCDRIENYNKKQKREIMKRKIRFHSAEYFREHHFIDGFGMISKDKDSLKTAFKVEVAGEAIDVRNNFPSGYLAIVGEAESTIPIEKWMVKEVYTIETHPEFWI